MSLQLFRNARFTPRGPIVLAILDGVGRGSGDESDAVFLAKTPTLDRLWVPGCRTELLAHGKAVGLPSDDDMGNSEVGHNAMGAGQIHDQGAKLVQRAIDNGSFFSGPTWIQLMQQCVSNAQSALHFLGLLSDGNVHSHQAHLEAMLLQAAKAGCKTLLVHALLDGRDVAPTSALQYIERLEAFLASLRTAHYGLDARIASGGGRMQITMDRYEADWAMVERGWKTHVHGAARSFASAAEAVATLRSEHHGIIDQDLPAFVITSEDRNRTGQIIDGDAVVLFNFRGDRAMEISRAFTDKFLTAFDRGRTPKVFFAGMMQYDGDLHIPQHYLVSPPVIANTMGEMLAANGVTQLAISETQKYGHVTYFWNGNRTGKFDDKLETYVEIPSDNVPFEQRPWMKCAEITDRLIAELHTGQHRFARVNYANGDMVGHTGSLDATIMAVAAVDLQLARLQAAVEKMQGILVVTADHGNADEMFQHDRTGRVLRDTKSGQPMIKTSHTLNRVPLMIHSQTPIPGVLMAQMATAGIANVTATCLELLGYTAPEALERSLIQWSVE
jgi:2,3-bisphosphoglycerate-independent phosphoglycerate mutase